MKRPSERSRYSSIAVCPAKMLLLSSGKKSTERNRRGDGAAASMGSASPDGSATVELLVPKSRPQAAMSAAFARPATVALGQVLLVGAAEIGEAALVEGEQARSEVGDEIAIVRDHEGGALVAAQRLAERD